MIWAAVASLLIHAVALLALVATHDPKPPVPEQPPAGIPKTLNVEIIEKSTPAEDKSPALKRKKEDGLTATHLKDNCDYWYGGIGVTIVYKATDPASLQPGHFYISEVYPGYPAKAAGIKKGDVLVDDTELKGEPNTTVEFTISRTGIVKQFKVVRDKICISAPTK